MTGIPALLSTRLLAIRAGKGTKDQKMQTPERHALRCVNELGIWRIRGYSYLKRAQQDCTDEREYRENCQYIEP
jgi:hypothetical protein